MLILGSPGDRHLMFSVVKRHYDNLLCDIMAIINTLAIPMTTICVIVTAANNNVS